MSVSECDQLWLQYQSLVGSLNWLSHTTRPDLSTVVSLLAQHQSNPSQGHMESALYVVQYFSHTKVFILVVYIELSWKHFFIFLFHLVYYLCLAQTGVRKMPPCLHLPWNYHYLHHARCPPIMLIF